jgi:circadian clock protein KaiC
MSPGEFTALVCRGVTERDPAVVIIDSLNGYLQAMPQDAFWRSRYTSCSPI